MPIKLIITDIDGVWTDGGMYYAENGIESKKFSTSDSVGILLARRAGIDVIVISGEDISCVRNRLAKLKMKEAYLGISDKLSLVEKICQERSISMEEIAFIGDEINDHALLKVVGFSCCPISAPGYTKSIVEHVVETEGGNGAFRDFVMKVLENEGLLEEAFNYISGASRN